MFLYRMPETESGFSFSVRYVKNPRRKFYSCYFGTLDAGSLPCLVAVSDAIKSKRNVSGENRVKGANMRENWGIRNILISSFIA